MTISCSGGAEPDTTFTLEDAVVDMIGMLLVQGAARLCIEGDEPLEMRAGAFVNIPSHTRHRIEWTDPNQPTIWLAIHYR